MYYDDIIDRYDGDNENTNWAAMMATFHQKDAPYRDQSLDHSTDQPQSQMGQKCIWCDVGNHAIDMIRAPFENNDYLNQAEPEYFESSSPYYDICKNRHIVAKIHHKTIMNGTEWSESDSKHTFAYP